MSPMTFGARSSHASAVRPKTIATRVSSGRMGPSMARSFSITSAASAEMSPGGCRTRTSSSHPSGSMISVVGSPTIIHCTKPISTSMSSEAAAASTALGGVPMSVATPPMEAA